VKNPIESIKGLVFCFLFPFQLSGFSVEANFTLHTISGLYDIFDVLISGLGLVCYIFNLKAFLPS
jgi:hypothetical protein